MKIRQFIWLFLVFVGISTTAQNKKFAVHTIAFYNLENFFDTVNDPKINDEDFIYTQANYEKKIDNLARVISGLGTSESQKNAPIVLGVAEIENRRVLEDLIKHPLLINLGYGIVHFDSPDRRGIDTGFLYQKKYFQPTSYQNYALIISDDMSDKKAKDKEKNESDTDDNAVDTATNRIYTRDQILMTGMLDGEEMSFIVNHWPSRRGGEKKSSPLREAAAALNKKIIDSLQAKNPNAKIFTMGDLNDGPFNKSIKEILGAKGEIADVKPQGLYNPAEKMLKKGIGTLAHRDAWDFFDQIIFTEALLPKNNNIYSTWTYWKAGVYNKPFMIQQTGQYKGYALRNSNEGPGFSDHFPSYVYLIKEFK